MAGFQFVLMTLLCLQVLAASPPAKKPASPMVPACLNNLMVKNEDCERAKSTIVYDKGILSKVETKVSVVSRDCLIEIYNPKQTAVTQKQIGDTVTEVLAACKSGHVRIKGNQDVGVWVTPRPKPRNWYSQYDPDVELGKAFCFAAAEGKVVKEECMQAFNQITTDNLGSLMNLNEVTPRHSYTSKYKSCRVTIYTTDGSQVTITKQGVLPDFTTMINTCGDQWGTVNIKGAQGPNGHVTIISRSY